MVGPLLTSVWLVHSPPISLSYYSLKSLSHLCYPGPRPAAPRLHSPVPTWHLFSLPSAWCLSSLFPGLETVPSCSFLSPLLRNPEVLPLSPPLSLWPQASLFTSQTNWGQGPSAAWAILGTIINITQASQNSLHTHLLIESFPSFCHWE